MNSKPTIKRHWLATLLAAVCTLTGTQTAWADDDPFYAARTARTNNTFTFSQPAYNVETTVEYVDAGASITPTGDNPEILYYEKLADALADAAAGDVIKLLADETITTGLTINNSITLDLNGKTLTYTGTGTQNEDALTISSGKTVIIIDTSTGAIPGKIEATGEWDNAISNYGTLTVNGGSITSPSGRAIWNKNFGTVTVNVGTISGRSGIINYGTLTVTGGSISTTGDNCNAISIYTGTFNLSGNPTISGTTADIYLLPGMVINIDAALTAPTTPWTVKPYEISVNNATSYTFTTGFSTYCLDGTDVADPASYFACTAVGTTTRLASNEAQFVQYIPLDADVAATVPVITNNGQDGDGTRTASLAEGNVWVGDELSVSTTATPGITWQWYRVSGTTETAISEATASTYTLTADDVDFTIIAKATQPANIAGTGNPASDVVVATAATVAVVKKDNFGTLTVIDAPTMDYIGATIATAAAGTEYMVIASSDDVLAENDARWSLATEGAGAALTLNKYIAIENEVAVEKNMLPSTNYKLYYRLKEITTTKHGNTLTTNTKPVNEANVAITTLAWNYQITSAGVTYKISEDPTASVTATVITISATGTGDHKTATILASIPADNEELVARIDVWSVLGYDVTSAEVGTGVFSSAIAVDANAFDSDMDLSAVGSTLETYGYVKAMDDGMYAWLMTGTPQATCTEEGYQIYLMNGGYYAVCNASDEYAMAGKSKRIEETMSTVLTIDGLTGDDQGAVQFKDKTGTALPVSTVAPNTGKIVAAPGQKVVVEVTLPAGFEFKADAENKKITVTGITDPIALTVDAQNNRLYTAEFTMPSSNTSVAFKEASPIQGFEITFTYNAPAVGGTVKVGATDTDPVSGTIRVLETRTYTLTPTAPAVDVEGAGYALTALGLPTGDKAITATIKDATTDDVVTLPYEGAVKVTFTVPATYTNTDAMTFAPVFTNTYENINFAAGNKTYYDDKGIALHGENAYLKFYTVSSVSGSTVTATEITTKQIPAGTPLIVKNTSGADIIARMDFGTYDAVTVANEFKGTAMAKALNAEGNGPWNWAANTEYYGFNGIDDFIWINAAGDVAAHKCWLEISTGNSAHQLTINWDGNATGIKQVDSLQFSQRECGVAKTVESYYDLNGRKLQSKPTKKGVYILNGKKMVVK